MGDVYTYLEIFAGAGGLSEGFLRNNFIPVAHIEKDMHASFTLKTRLAYYHLKEHDNLMIYEDYIRGAITREELYSSIPEELINSVINIEIREDNLEYIFKKIEENMASLGVKKIDVIVGGPPCQAYSLVGRARDPYKMEKDPRNYMYRLYTRFLMKFKPDVFIFENVPGLLSAGGGKLWEDIREHFREAGYDLSDNILNAYDFGVLQKRLRVIVVGWKKELPAEYPEFEKDEKVKNYMVKDVLNDLPAIDPGEKILHGEYSGPPSQYLLEYGIRYNNDILTLHMARKHNERDREIYRIAIEKWRENGERLKYTDIPGHLRTHNNLNGFPDRFKVIADNLPYAHTVVAHIAKDGHYYIHPDINQLRSLSVREAARLQSFPDNYYFEGPMTAKFRQIGNAVPPLMAEKIAEKIKEVLK
ncbi:MAG TPA: DNA (cytosine-5-)-methyltransferase [Thermoplasmatales archaeon]|nr:DNA (cytosine-5-)-methyltransferase [Thermoplasmatales archaeon]